MTAQPGLILARPRQILELMQIDVWILRHTPVQTFTPDIWRDQAPADLPLTETRHTAMNEAPDIAEFSLNALVTSHCAVIVDLRQLSDKDLQLWENIAKAVPHERITLEPSDLLKDRSARSVHSYIQGFLKHAIGAKQLIFVGPVPVGSTESAMVLPPLNQWHENTDIKRQLWNILKDN